jgi:glycosyltransferase involved in cell wall biosynthesis
MGKKPRVSIGIPVYNGEAFLASALDALLAQSFRDFEIIISDNASTDQTGEICRAYAAKDSRIRYGVNEQNIGLARNHNRLIELASGEYFMWHAHDDQSTSEYLARCVQVLDHHPEIVLCFAATLDIDEHGSLIEADNPHRRRAIAAETLALDAKAPHLRFRDIIKLEHQCEPDYGVMRLEVLRETPMHGKYADADRVLLAEMALHGPFHMIREPLFLHREHDRRSVIVYPSRHARTALLDPAMAGRVVFPHWKELGELWACTERAPIEAKERIKCRVELLKWAVDYRGRLASDLRVGTRVFLKKVLPQPLQRTVKRMLRREQSLP